MNFKYHRAFVAIVAVALSFFTLTTTPVLAETSSDHECKTVPDTPREICQIATSQPCATTIVNFKGETYSSGIFSAKSCQSNKLHWSSPNGISYDVTNANDDTIVLSMVKGNTDREIAVGDKDKELRIKNINFNGYTDDDFGVSVFDTSKPVDGKVLKIEAIIRVSAKVFEADNHK